MKVFILYFSVILFLFSCNENKIDNTSQNKNLIQKPTKENYTEGEILVVIDTIYWKGAIGDSIRNIFLQAVYGLPQGEPSFKVKRVDPHEFKGSLTKFNNIFIVANINSTTTSSKYMNGLLGNKNLYKAKSNEPNKPPFFVNSDVYSKGQHLVYVLAQSDEELKQKLSENKASILNYFDQKVAHQLMERYYYGNYNENLTASVKKKFGVNFHIPRGFQFAKEAEKFLWFRFPELDIDKNIFISEMDYINENQFSDEFLNKWRDSLGINLIKEKGDTNYYMMTQEYVPLEGQIIMNNGNYTKLCRGLWKLKDNSLGGPFISYVTLNKDKTKIYYIEGFVAAPGINKRKIIRELRAIITSFQG